MTKPTICLDVDGVLAEYYGWRGTEHIGEPIPGAVEFTEQLAKMATIIIFSTRLKEHPMAKDILPLVSPYVVVKDWLDQHGFIYDEIYCGQGKPFAVAYVDDRGVTCRPQESHTPEFEFQFALAAVATLLDKVRKKDISSVVLSGSLN